MKDRLKNRIFVGIVEDNADPKQIGRCKISVPTVFDTIPTSSLPWASPQKDLNGNEFSTPEIGKVVSVIFEDGNQYQPKFIYAEHYNINLENKLKSLSSDDYATFKSIHLDGSTQIYRSNSQGLVLDHEYSNINLDPNGNINLNARDNNSKINIGSSNASQAAMLGSAFLTWMDTMMNLIQADNAFLANGSPVIASPDMIDVITQYQASKTPDFLSNNIWIVDNNEVQQQTRPYIVQNGDTWKSTTETNTLTTSGTPSYTPIPTPVTGRPTITNTSPPGDITQNTIISEATIKTVNVSNYQNGQVPLSAMIQNKNLSTSLSGDSTYLIAAASNALDLMMQAYNNASFTGKQNIVFTDGYRTLARQQALYVKYGSGRAAIPGTSNHGWGIAIDMYWGVRTNMNQNYNTRPSAYRHPVYKWFLENGYQYGWFNPTPLRDDNGTDEWWHWEYHGVATTPAQIISSRYDGSFTQTDKANITTAGGTYLT